MLDAGDLEGHGVHEPRLRGQGAALGGAHLAHHVGVVGEVEDHLEVHLHLAAVGDEGQAHARRGAGAVAAAHLGEVAELLGREAPGPHVAVVLDLRTHAPAQVAADLGHVGAGQGAPPSVDHLGLEGG